MTPDRADTVYRTTPVQPTYSPHPTSYNYTYQDKYNLRLNNSHSETSLNNIYKIYR